MKFFCNNCGKVIEPEIPADAHEVTCPLCSGTVQVPESPLSPGAVIGDFLLEKPLSSGGMGVVYLARQISLDRPVALKVLHDKFASNKEYIDGLFREARAAAKLTHPNIVQAYAVGEENGIFYFAMEYIQGKTFKQILKEQNILDFVQAVKVIREICGALQAAWTEQKLVHQDIKPDNIMLASNGFSKLADLGLARSANTDSGPGEDENEVMGTPQYISPEQLTGVPTDVRSDLYSLGATFYQFVTGQFPYPEETAEEMARKHVEGNLTPPIKINPELPIQLSDIIVRMMARNIDERFQTPNDVIAALDAYTEQKKISSMAVPKLKLNLNKKTAAPAAKPGMSTNPTAPAPGKPAAPAPSLSKPAAPAAPSLSKPAVPAAPSLSKPAVPAAPSLSKPAVPATPPSAPAPVPAPAPAPAPAPVPAPVPAPQEKGQGKSEGEISLAPKASKPKAEEKEKGDSENKSADNKQGKNGKKDNKEKGSGSKTAKILLLILLPLLLIALIASLFFTAYKGFLGAKMQKFALSAASSIGIKSPDKKSETAQTPQAPEKVSKPVVSVPPPPPAPVTRKEFISEIDRLKGFYRSNPAKNSISFLEGVEKLQQRYLPTVTKEESATYKSLRKIYASVDEGVRAQNYRKAVIEKLQKELDAKVQAAADAKRAAEEKARELAAQQAAAAARMKEAQKERDTRLKKLQNDLDVMYKKLAEAFLTSIRTNNIETLKSVMTEFADFSVPNATNTEYGMLEEFKTFRDQFLPKAFKEFAQFHEHLKGVTMSKSIAAGSRMDIEIVRIDPPPQGVYKAVQVNQQKKLVKIKLNRRLRTDIYDYLNAEAKIKNAAFFYEFMEGKFRTQMTPAMLPSKNWSRFIKVFKRSIPSLGIPNSLLR